MDILYIGRPDDVEVLGLWGDYYRYMTSGRLERPGASIYYEVTGSGPALAFAHGLGGNHMSWWQQVPYWAARYTCVTFAHRGSAPSRCDNPDPAEFAGDLAALLDRLGLEEAALVAQSMGGWTCLDFAIRYPHRVWALVMASTSGIVDPTTLAASDLRKLQEWMSANTGVEADLFRRGIHPAAGERMAREQPALEFLYREIDRMSAGLDKNALRGKLVAARTLPASRLRELKMPVLFVTGTEDIVIPPPLVEGLSAIVPGAKLEIVPEAGHSVYFERAERFNRVVDKFLSL
jgi:3-oxoadipate enol-lactonase